MKRNTCLMMSLATALITLTLAQSAMADDGANQPLDKQDYQAAIQSFGVEAGIAEQAAEQSVATVAASRQFTTPNTLMEDKFARVVENLKQQP